MNIGKKAFIATVTCLAAAVCTTAGAQSNNSDPPGPKEPVFAFNTAPDTAAVFDAQQPSGPLKGGGAGHSPVCVDCGAVSFTQSSDPVTITAGTGVACVAGGGITAENSYYRGFTLADHGVPSPFEVCGIQFGIESAVDGTGGGAQPITIRLYDTGDPTLADAGNLVAEVVTTVGDQALTLECISITGTVTSGGLTVEIFIPDSVGLDNNTFFFGANVAPEVFGTTYIKAPTCGILVPTPVADIGFPDAHLVMTVFGGEGEKFCPNDVNGDLVINVLDLIELLLCFGAPDLPPCDTGQDINQDGVINVLDLIDLLLRFGADCPPQNFLKIVCDQGSVRPANPLCCDFTWTVTNNGPVPVDTFYLDLEAGPVGVMDCRSIGLPGWVATACYPWDNNAQSNWAVYCFTGGVLLPGESKSGGFLNVEVNPTVGGSVVNILGWLSFTVPEMAVHCHVTSVDPADLGVDCSLGQFGPHIDADADGAPDQPWSPGNNWICFSKDVCEGAEVINLPAAPHAPDLVSSGGNNTTVGATIDLDALVCLDQISGLPVEILAPGNWYSVIGNGATLTATTCNLRLLYDTAISVYSGTCGSLSCVGNSGANVDGGIDCVLLGGPITDGSIVTWCSAVGVPYLILVHGANAAEAGSYRLDIISDGIVCSLCDPGKTPEGEPICADEYVDIFNGGCNSTPEIFLPITCGQAYCGEYGTFIVTDPDPPNDPINSRDTDWYQITTVVNTVFTWKVTGECETLFGVIDGSLGCAGAAFLNASVAGASSRGTIVTQCLPPGVWWFFVAPANFDGCPCGSEYTAALTCVEGCVQTIDQCGGRVDIFDSVLTPFDTTGMNTDGPAHASCKFNDQTFHDIWYNYTAACNGEITITTCEELGGSATYDTDLAVYDGCECGVGLEDPPLGCNDDDPVNACGTMAGGFHSTLVVPVIAGNCYKIRVGGFADGDFGPGELLVTCGAAVECPLVCDPAVNKVPENEPVCVDEYVDLTNGGCNSTPEVFGVVACDDGVGPSEAICGEYGNFLVAGGQTRDTDWYKITTVAPTDFTWTVTGQCNTLLGVIDGNLPCAGAVFLVSTTTGACVAGSVTTGLLPAGDYWFFVATAAFVGCDCGSEYNAKLTCVP